MSKDKTNDIDHLNENGSPEGKPVEGRRKLVKKLATGGAIAAAVPVIPKQWAKPVTDSVLLPAHAQTSTAPALSLSAVIEIDNVDGAGNVITTGPGVFISSPGVTNFPNEDIDTIELDAIATISPAQAANVTMNVAAPFDFTGGGINQVVATNPVTGQAVFSNITNQNDHDFDLPSTVVVTFDAPGFTQQSFTFNISA
ncbi:MAG: hypothetical protein BMS9Abin25_0004 [Gammaproteobacteria bacterium]|nr:MAG: hypothetical protein BMS9Abin25_0004 [Gammaproteobacteria bacterium]